MQTKSEFTPSTSQPGRGSEAAATTVAAQVSGPLTALLGSAFVSGAAFGLLEFLQRSPIRAKYTAGTAAWWPQLALAAATIVILGSARVRHLRRFGPRSGRLWLLAPVGRQAALRIAHALGFGGERARPGRVLLALPAAALLLYCFWRAGVQLTAGLDPNFTVNAWGGPSYAGALACHYLDLFVLGAAAYWLLDRILPA